MGHVVTTIISVPFWLGLATWYAIGRHGRRRFRHWLSSSLRSRPL